ncbi:FG-GAP-like repeat-containing protein [Streptomyces sp. L-9-10]|uniref:FG-GAP-like repeat-containing protein n=1 Tax=Streptomyces sp. L-9-10 TaxID=1478131 RepID=UPI00101DE6E1|nr:FG-GAP-like repeat-containing protein [Streptomyces sp. L-9-10]
MFGQLSRTTRRVVVSAVTLAAAALAVGTVTALPHAPWSSEPAASGEVAVVKSAAAVTGPKTLSLFGRKSNGHLYDYEPNGTGGVKAAVDLGGGFGEATALVQAGQSENGAGSDLYFRMANTLYYTAERGSETKIVGNGWDIFNLLMSPGNLGGTAQDDIVGRDAAGALWLYQGKADGMLLARIRIGTAGWNGMDVLTGRGDYTGDGKSDLIARSTTGTLYIYPGTGNATADAALGARVTVGTGWGTATYKTLVSTGDSNGDGKADLIAVDPAGALWLFKGTGNASAPFAARVQIGTTGWTAFNTLF